MSLRLFVAVDVPAEVRDRLHDALGELRRAHPTLRWTKPASWHLTLAFLGWVEEDRAPAVSQAVSAAARPGAPFALRLDGRIGDFGQRVLWAGLDKSEPLTGLAERVRAELQSRGFTLEERPFHAHLTLARAPKGGRVPKDLGARWKGPQPEWEIHRVLVMRSHLRREGARYETWFEAALGG